MNLKEDRREAASRDVGKRGTDAFRRRWVEK